MYRPHFILFSFQHTRSHIQPLDFPHAAASIPLQSCLLFPSTLPRPSIRTSPLIHRVHPPVQRQPDTRQQTQTHALQHRHRVFRSKPVPGRLLFHSRPTLPRTATITGLNLRRLSQHRPPLSIHQQARHHHSQGRSRRPTTTKHRSSQCRNRRNLATSHNGHLQSPLLSDIPSQHRLPLVPGLCLSLLTNNPLRSMHPTRRFLLQA